VVVFVVVATTATTTNTTTTTTAAAGVTNAIIIMTQVRLLQDPKVPEKSLSTSDCQRHCRRKDRHIKRTG
jgi:hypothetical protein